MLCAVAISFGRRGRIICAWLVLSVVGSMPQSASTQAPLTGPLVTVEFRATDRNRQAVLDLKVGEVTLTVDGRERTVRSLELRRTSAAALPAPFASNSNRDVGRDVIFAVDEESILPGSIDPVKEALTAMLSMLEPADRAAVMSLHPNGANAALTAQHTTVQAAIAGVRGRAFSRESSIELACRTRLALQRLTTFFDSLPRGVTTTVLVFSAALGAPAAAAVSRIGVEGGCVLQPVHFDDFRDAVLRSAAQVYGVRVVDPGLPDDAEKGAGLEKLAGSVDGQFLRLAGDPSEQLRRITRETATYYLASIELDSAESKGARRSIDVRVRRDGVKTFVRRDVMMVASDPPGSKSPREMIRVATAFRALPLRAMAYPSRNPTDQAMKVVVLFEPEGSTTLKSAMAGLFNAKGQLITQWESDPTDLAKRTVVAGLVAPIGSYRLRVAAVDASGRSGAVDDDIRVDLTSAGPLKLSAILLGTLEGGSMSPRLQFDPADAAAVAYLEAYGRACSGLTASIELAASGDGPALIHAPASTTVIDQSDTCIIYGGFEIGTLKPGDYVVRAVVSVDGKTVGQLTRTLRKTS